MHKRVQKRVHECVINCYVLLSGGKYYSKARLMIKKSTNALKNNIILFIINITNNTFSPFQFKNYFCFRKLRPFYILQSILFSKYF